MFLLKIARWGSHQGCLHTRHPQHLHLPPSMTALGALGGQQTWPAWDCCALLQCTRKRIHRAFHCRWRWQPVLQVWFGLCSSLCCREQYCDIPVQLCIPVLDAAFAGGRSPALWYGRSAGWWPQVSLTQLPQHVLRVLFWE